VKQDTLEHLKLWPGLFVVLLFAIGVSACLDGPECRFDSDCQGNVSCQRGWCIHRESVERNLPEERNLQDLIRDAGHVEQKAEKESPVSCFEGPEKEGIHPDQACQTAEKCIGVSRCEKGQWRCVVKKSPSELCRNGLDDDCNGQIDEICGPAYPFVSLKTDLASSIQRGIAKQSFPGKDIYKVSFRGHRCDQTPLIVNVQKGSKCGYSVYCDPTHSSDYIVQGCKNFFPKPPFGNKKGRFLHAVVPRIAGKKSGGFLAILDPKRCSSSPKSGDNCPFLKVERSSKDSITESSFTYRKAGYYQFRSSLCQPYHPMFATPFGKQGLGFAIVFSKKASTCQVHIFSETGDYSTLSVAIWLPEPTTHVWFSANASGKMVAQNKFGQRKELWDVEFRSGSERFGKYYRIRYPGLVNQIDKEQSPAIFSMVPALKIYHSFVFLYPGEIRLFLYSGIPSFNGTLTLPFWIMLIQ